MSITLFGLLALAAGGFLAVFGSALSLLCLVLLATLFGGSAAITLSTGSSIQPASLLVVILAGRCAIGGGATRFALVAAAKANAPLAVFTAYGVLTAPLLPFIFAGAIDVTPLRPIVTHDPFAVFPLAFSSQNLTTAGYLLTTFMGAIGAFVAVQYRGAADRVVTVATTIAIAHAMLGFAGLVAAHTPLQAVFDFFRNGSYNQLDQEIGGIVRMNGIFAEASNYAAFAVGYFVLMVELWLRDVRPRWTGLGAALLGLALVVATSSSGYIALGGYAVILGIRLAVAPGSIPARKVVEMAAICACGLIIVAALALARPAVLATIETVYRKMIVEKSASTSGMVRLMWAKQGFEAFFASGGLGVGAGSFRSSSLPTAILGSMGIVGLATYLLQSLRVTAPFRRSTYYLCDTIEGNLSAAFSWAFVAQSIPQIVGAPSPDPGLSWGLIAGLALGFRLAEPRRAVDGRARSPARESAHFRAMV